MHVMAVENDLADVWPGCDPTAGSDDRTAEAVLWGVLLVVMTADVVLTLAGLQQGLSEGNAVVRAAIDAFGPAGLWLIKGGAVGLGVVAASAVSSRVKPLIPLALAIPTSFAVAVNLTLFGML